VKNVTLAAVALLLFAAGCGYTLIGRSGSGSHVLGRVVVHTPENGSGHPGIDLVVADALRREVMRRTGAQLVDDDANADWVVSGKTVSLLIQPASLSPVVLTLEYQVSLGLELSARARDGREIKGDPREMRETERFLSSGDVEAQRKNRGEALQRVSRLLAARFLDRIDEEQGG